MSPNPLMSPTHPPEPRRFFFLLGDILPTHPHKSQTLLISPTVQLFQESKEKSLSIEEIFISSRYWKERKKEKTFNRPELGERKKEREVSRLFLQIS